MKKGKKKKPSMSLLAYKALREAVAKTILDHKKTGDPIVVWKNGKVVWIPASQLPIKSRRKKLH